VRLVQHDRCSGLGRGDGSRQPAKPTANHGHRCHAPYHTVWYVAPVPTRSDWLETGLTALADDGPNGLRIDRLCRRLGVSKGSFHHHFAGTGDFKKALLAAYEARVVKALEQAIEQTATATPKAALAGLTAAITSQQSFYRPDLEVAMRAWAFSDREVRAVQERVDLRRLESLRGIWSNILDDPAAVQAAALVPYLVGIGASLVQPPTPPEELQRVYELLLDLVPNESQQTSAQMP
jgi:AcrR family transcriptional regulator